MQLVGVNPGGAQELDSITAEQIASAEQILGLSFTAAERDSMIQDLERQREGYLAMREVLLRNEIPPATLFSPIPLGVRVDTTQVRLIRSDMPPIQRPQDLEELARELKLPFRIQIFIF